MKLNSADWMHVCLAVLAIALISAIVALDAMHHAPDAALTDAMRVVIAACVVALGVGAVNAKNGDK